MRDLIITFDPPLPCAVRQGDRRCAQEATVGTLSPIADGTYILQPICRACVAALVDVYRPDRSYRIVYDERVMGGAAIECLRCGQTSYHPTDVAERYCPRCKRFHEGAP